MGVAEDYRRFCDGLRIKNKATIATRYANITRRLNFDFWGTASDVAHSLYVGSYGRNTGIDGISDVDVLFRLPHSVYRRYKGHVGNGQSALLQAVRSSVVRSYPRTTIGADGQVVVVTFAQGPKFEVLPAFLNKDGSYTHPDTNRGGSWKPTNPKAEILAMRAVDARCNGNLSRLCRMMRVWKQENGVPITSFLIDTLAYQFIQTWPHRERSYACYDLLVRDFLGFLAGRNPEQGYWGAPGSGRRALRIGRFEGKSRLAYERLAQAIKYEAEKRPKSAHKVRREVFGGRFR